MSRRDEMAEQCTSFHQHHPEVWDLFVQFTTEMIDKGFSNYSCNAIFERIRWEKDTGGNGTEAFKLNNNYRAMYARRFMKMYPEHEGFFRTREQTSEDNPATGLPELTPANYG